jgi:hypothetical protein
MDFVIELIPMMVVQYLMLTGVVPLARKASPRRAWAWIVAALIPLVGGMMFIFLMMKALAVILERIDSLSAMVGSQPSRKTDLINSKALP